MCKLISNIFLQEYLSIKRKFFPGELYVSWEIIDFCDLACDYCYALIREKNKEGKNIFVFFDKNVEEKNIECTYQKLSLEKIEEGLNKLKLAGVDTINFEGGEPTIREDILKIIKLAKDKKMKAILSTHGRFLLLKNRGKYLAEKLRKNLDFLSIPIDSEVEKIDNKIKHFPNNKPSDHFKKTINFLKWYGNEWKKNQKRRKLGKNIIPLYGLKINVVVTKENKDHIAKIGEIIKKYIPAEASVQLKIIQFIPRGMGKEKEKTLGITQKQFNEIYKKIEMFNQKDLHVTKRTYTEEIYPFMVIGFNGDIVIPKAKIQKPLEVATKTGKQKLNLFSSNFNLLVEKFLKNDPSFKNRNKIINTYSPCLNR